MNMNMKTEYEMAVEETTERLMESSYELRKKVPILGAFWQAFSFLSHNVPGFFVGEYLWSYAMVSVMEKIMAVLAVYDADFEEPEEFMTELSAAMLNSIRIWRRTKDVDLAQRQLQAVFARHLVNIRMKKVS